MNNKTTYNPNTPKRIALRNKRWTAYYDKHKAPILKKLYRQNREASVGTIKILDFLHDGNGGGKDLKRSVPKYIPYFVREVIRPLNNSDRHSTVDVRVRSKTNQGNISAGKTSQIIRILQKPLYGRNLSFEYNGHKLKFSGQSLVQDSVSSNLNEGLANPSYYLPILRDVAELPWVKLEITIANYTLEVNEKLEITSGYTDSWVNNSPNSFVEGGG
ncbi:MAG: hypothetical protein EBT78_08115 [Betaproteobacteria bacterium]|jgi:hypothetical protein|nr:hypothetical protein [Betaproteobacteria bacterium]